MKSGARWHPCRLYNPSRLGHTDWLTSEAIIPDWGSLDANCDWPSPGVGGAGSLEPLGG